MIEKALALDILTLLSALESSMLCGSKGVPDHVWEQLSNVQVELRDIILDIKREKND
jgi:hypothetical protein